MASEAVGVSPAPAFSDAISLAFSRRSVAAKLLFDFNHQGIVESVEKSAQADPQCQFDNLCFREILPQTNKHVVPDTPCIIRNRNRVFHDHLVDFEQVERLAKEHSPKLIIAGGSAYPRTLDFKRFREIADSVGALLMVDMAHFAGLVATGVHPSPLPFADVVTTTTHKTLRGPRGGMILTNREDLGKKFNSAVFPGLQGGPLMHVIAAKAVAFGEALTPEFRSYSQSVVDNAKVLASVLKERGCDIVAGGTDTHVVLVDLRPKGLTGNITEEALERAGMTCNKNGVPFDPEKPTVTSGVRLGSPAATTRGFGVAEFRQIGDWIADVLDGLAVNGDNNSSVEQDVRAKVRSLCDRFPVYQGF